MDALPRLFEEMGESLDRRRGQMDDIRRALGHVKGTVYYDAIAHMCCPAIYGHWEGFAKEAFLLYLEYVERCGVSHRELSPRIVAYAWEPDFRRLQGKSGVEDRASFVRRAMECAHKSVSFKRNGGHQVDTRSNLRYNVLVEIGKWLCVDLTAFAEHERAIDAFVNRRNNVAHGGRQGSIDVASVEEDIQRVKAWMEMLERAVQDAATSRSFAPAVASS